MVDVSSQNNSVSINVSTGGNSASIKATPDMAQYYSEKSREWAISNRIVDNTDYSSKYYAEKSATSENNAKVYATEAKESYNGVVAEVENTISQITAAGTQAVEEINSVSNNTKQEVTQLGENLKEEIVQKEQEAIADITQEAQKQLQNIESTGFYMRDDKLYFINSKGEEEEFKSGGGSGFNLFDTKISDHILEGDEAKGWALQGTYITKALYPDFYNKCLEEKSNATATETTLAESTLTIFVNNNGHQFYNIAYKAIIDTFFETYGIADFYGIDEENERIFLPRNKYFQQLTVDASNVNKMMEAGSPNITGTMIGGGATGGETSSYTGAFKYTGSAPSKTYNAASGENANTRANFDASLSNPIYGNSDTVQPPSSLKLLYYCVGNTEVKNAITNVTEITESENDSNPLGSSFYFNNIQPNAGWLKSEGQWNDGNIYKTFYNWLVEEKTTNTTRTDIKDVSEVYTDFDYVLNQDDMTFRLPLLNGDESIMSKKYDDIDFPNTTTFTAPANGWYYIHHLADSASNFVTMSRTDKAFADMVSTRILTVANNWAMFVSMQAYKGEQIKITSTSKKPVEYARFYYAKGNGDLYFKVANAVQNIELLNVAEVLETVNRVIPNNSEVIAGYGLPDYSSQIILEFVNSEETYIAPTKGWFSYGFMMSGNNTGYIKVNGVQVVNNRPAGGSYYDYVSGVIPVDKNDEIKCYSNETNHELRFFAFYPMKGIK